MFHRRFPLTPLRSVRHHTEYVKRKAYYGSPSLEVIKFAIYVFFPVFSMYYFNLPSEYKNVSSITAIRIRSKDPSDQFNAEDVERARRGELLYYELPKKEDDDDDE